MAAGPASEVEFLRTDIRSAGATTRAFAKPWPSVWSRNFFQVLDTADFWKPLRARAEYYANWPYTKAVAERIVCQANSKDFRTGCIRPANGVYGKPTDNTVGGALNTRILPS